ncbi:hypothetical protein CONLIGDRAFT_100551 [Coniochaeta ligniaria NRRL 30616]|uniref:Zn(2)-C6 fungal-type domain-containing protein n=1 Tax=Coniochaeta ligniaria NRRL 30616 TaxID=1408157 RepID=A0A1J7IU19_9PEZI|nr:hypothetical protein CONLIGDRAFT_100551 [Coniochaeta ligniaria NRRL 30616]
MVFTGKPSRACGRCRLRRLKCDEGTPLCSACLRAKAESCEYRDVLNLSFRDQNEKVMRKSQQAKKNSVALVPRVPIGAKDPTSPSPYRDLACPMAQLARGYMYTNYMAESHFGGYLPCLVTLAEGRPGSALPAAITAVGLAALANIHHCPEVMWEARQECNAAISLTKSVLDDPVASRRDDVLAAVVMLSMFEVMTYSDAASIRRWMGHVDGATRILEIRGEDQLNSAEGLELFRHLRVGICLSSILRERQNSPMIARLTEKAKHRMSPQGQTVDNLATVVLRINDFCAALTDETFKKPSDIIRAALKLDGDLVASLLDVPSSSSFNVVKVADSTEKFTGRTIWGDTYHVYRSIAVSSMWSNYRSARILLREIIVDALHAAEDTDHNQNNSLIKESRQIAAQLVDEVCASVPYHMDTSLHLHRAEPEERLGASTSSDIGRPAPPFLGTVGTGGCITMLWPLLVAANSGFASLEQREWIIGCLDRIGRGMGIGQASAMAQLLRDGRQSRTWLTTGDDIKGLGL